MNPEKPDAQLIFGEALRLKTSAERAAYLDQVCAGNQALRQEVESLLRAYDKAQAGDFLGQTRQLSAFDLLSESTGTMIGRYKLLEQIGEGGMGVVYMAEQEEPVRRRVALKIIKLGMDTRQVVARFEAERQALAMMDHPNIARVFDGGATDTGRPYFVMELVKGIPITEYCDANKLSTRERLELFMQVCHAVQHAHQKGVIHRDLKPSNILVTVQDDRPVPKVIDFGVAKATQARLTQKTLFTRFQQWIGTPAYMSPEQAGLGSLDVDTRSDVYSLGVLLYELLIGRTPFDTEKLLAAGYDAVMRTIREEEPPKPSTRLSTLAEEELTAVAAQRGSEPAKLNRLIRGDLDWIVMKAIDKDRTRRYETARDFEQDIHRHLGAEPVSAAAPGTMYLAGKFLRRNGRRLVFGTVAVVALALALVAVKLTRDLASAWQDFVSKGTNTVFTFARADDVKKLSRLLDTNPNLVRQRDAEGATPLECAAIAGSTNALRLLLARGADVNATNNDGFTPLLYAAGRGHVGAVAALLAAGANPNHPANNGVTALMVAAQNGAVEVGRLLLAKGARADAAVPPATTTALVLAAKFGHAPFVELLLEHGAHVDLKDATGNTPLNAAALGLSLGSALRIYTNQLGHLNTDKPGLSLAGATAVVLDELKQLQTALPEDVLRGGGNHRRVAELLLARKADLEATNANGCTPLFSAALFTNLPVAELLIAHGANLNSRAKEGSGPLNLAALQGSVPMTELLLKAGANVNLQDNTGFTPLNTAVEQGHLGVVKALLAHDADPNLANRQGGTPLHSAAWRGDIETMRLLLNRGAALEPLCRAGTPLIWAVGHRQPEAVQFLLRQGAKSDVAPPESGITALHWAAALGYPDIARLLLESGATVDADSRVLGTPLYAAAGGPPGTRQWLEFNNDQLPQGAEGFHPMLGSNEDYVAVMRMLLAAKANVEARGPFRATPLHAAAKAGTLEMVRLLLDARAPINAVGPNLCTPLQLAVIYGHRDAVELLLARKAELEWRNAADTTALFQAVQAQAPDIATLLLDHGADVNVGCTNGVTALMVSAGNGDLDTMKLLLKRGAKVDATNAFGQTAFLVASEAGKVEAARFLLEKGAKSDVASKGGYTPLLLAARGGHLEMLKFLLDECGATPADKDEDGFTALHEAANNGHAEVVEFLLGRGIKVNVRSENYLATPLHCVAQGDKVDPNRRVAVARVLIEHGADVNAKNSVDQTPLHRAADWGNAEIIPVLLAAGANPDIRDKYGKTALDIASATARPGLRPNIVAGRKRCAELLRANHQVQPPGTEIQQSSPSTNPPAGESQP